MADDLIIRKIERTKTKRGKRFLERREPQLVEDVKKTIIMRSSKANQLVIKLLKNLCAMKKPDCVFFNRKELWRPFEDITPFEFMSQKNDASLFMYTSQSKKKPNNLVMGRTFDGHILDMVELEVQNIKLLEDFKNTKVSTGCKPIIIFSGTEFETEHSYIRIKNLLLDFFNGPKTDGIRLVGLEYVIQLTVFEGKIYFRSFKILMKKSGSKTPRIELEEMGPRFDLVVRNTQLASDDLFKRSKKQPLQLKPRKIKNISKTGLGSKMGRIHMERQDYGRLQTRKLKGLKTKRNLAPEENEIVNEENVKKVRFSED